MLDGCACVVHIKPSGRRAACLIVTNAVDAVSCIVLGQDVAASADQPVAQSSGSAGVGPPIADLVRKVWLMQNTFICRQ